LADRHAYPRVRPAGLAVLTVTLLCAAPALAQTTAMNGNKAGMNAGYGFSPGELSNPVSVATTDANGNRVIVDGVIQTGSDQSMFYTRRTGGAGDSYAGAGGIGSATAIGNNLQVTVTGDHNVVVVNSSQTNTGNVTAGTVLNGKVDLNANGG
jgi:holdfast attachment protein HfaA